MGDENQPSKKRAAGRQLNRDNLDDEEDIREQEMGTFKKASDEVLSGRRIVKVRRQQTSTAPSAPSSNPFSGVRLVPPTVPAATSANPKTEAQAAEDKTACEDPDEKDGTNSDAEVTSKESEEKPSEAATESSNDKVKEVIDEHAVEVNQPDHDEKEADGIDEKTDESLPADEKQAEGGEAENDDKKDNEDRGGGSGGGGGGGDGVGGDAPLSSFQQLSNNQNAFTGLAGPGFSTTAFSFGSVQKDDSAPSQSSLPTFSFGTSNNGSAPLFGTTGASKSEVTGFRPMQEVLRVTGEENEETVFSSDSALFEFFDGGWKERGKGEVKVNVEKGGNRKSRLVMRGKGNLRLILNARLYSDMKLTKMDKKGITFACVNTATEGKDGLSTFALKFKDVSVVEECSSVVSAYKDKPATASRTPENSPKARDD